MKKSILFSALFLTLLICGGYAQNKKVAVVTFYAAKVVDVSAIGSVAMSAEVERLADNPEFNMAPLLKNFHDHFFESYAANFPFQLLPEEQVVNNSMYKNFIPEGMGVNDILKGNSYIPVKGYKVILPLKKQENEKNLLKMFDECDGLMKVYINFDMDMRGLGKMALVKVNAHANIVIFNRNGDKVFSIQKDAISKKSGAQVAGIPFFVPGKILPLCESAMDELTIALDNDLPKMMKKADRKL